MKIFKLFVGAFISASFLVSCSDDELKVPIYTPQGSYDSGVLVLNEGGFGASNSTVSYVSFDLKRVENNIFGAVNPSLTLGSTGQSIGFNGNLAYIVMNGSNKIQIVNRYTMANVGTITTGLDNPRYIVFSNGKGFVTNWGSTSLTNDDYVAVVNLATNTISSTIPVVEGPEQLIVDNSKIYVAHKGGYGFGNSISVINAATNALLTNITVGNLPNTMQIDNGSLWVLCEGSPSYAPSETAGKLHKINLTTNAIETTYSFPAATHPSNLTISNNRFYYTINSNIYSVANAPIAPATSIVLPSTPIITATIPNLYGFAIKNNHIYVSGYSTFNSNGSVAIYSEGLYSEGPKLGTLEKTATVGIGPNGFYFNQ